MERYRAAEFGAVEVPMKVGGEVEWMPVEVAAYIVATRQLAETERQNRLLEAAVKAIPGKGKLIAGALMERMRPHGRTDEATDEPGPGPVDGPEPGFDQRGIDGATGPVIEHGHPANGAIGSPVTVHAHPVGGLAEPHFHGPGG